MAQDLERVQALDAGAAPADRAAAWAELAAAAADAGAHRLPGDCDPCICRRRTAPRAQHAAPPYLPACLGRRCERRIGASMPTPSQALWRPLQQTWLSWW